MRQLKRIFSTFLLIGFFITSCDKAQDLVVAPPATASLLKASATTLAPARTDSNSSVLTLIWTYPNHAVANPNTIKYTIEVDSAGKNFSQPLTKVVTGSLSTDFLAKDFNNYLLARGYNPGAVVNLDIRLTSSYANNNERTSSNIVRLAYTPYAIRVIVNYNAPKALWVAGNFQGWDPATAPKLVDTTATATSGTNYEGYINFGSTAAPAFKLVKGNNWSAGDFGNASGGKLSNGGSDLTLPSGGVYRLRANTAAMTWSFTKIDTWGIIGSATANGWGSSTAMTMNADGTYSITAPLTVGEFKFRANNEWAIDFGDNTSGGGPDNVPDYGGSNIAITSAGNYLITLDLTRAGNYYYTMRKL